MIEFLCPRCQTPLMVGDGDAGRKQRCPKCQGKLRVPAPPAAASAAAIEFRCPRCHALMHAPAEKAGTKEACPGCGAKVRVPVVAESSARESTSSDPPGPPLVKGGKGLEAGEDQNSGWKPEDEEEVPEGIPAIMAARHNPLPGLLLPVACVAVLAGIGAWLLYKPEPKLEGSLTGERLTDNEFGPFRLDNGFLGERRKNAREVFSSLESEPIRAVSPMLLLEFQGSPDGISVSIRAADGSEFCRVDPRQDKFLAKYLDKEREQYEAFRDRELRQSVPEFFRALERRPEGERDVEGLATFRNSVGLTSILRGFGLQVQAVIGRKVYPCVHEDAEGCLYFSLPVETQEFELTARERKGSASREDRPFPGRYQVVVPPEPVTVKKQAPDPKEKIRKLLRE